jgi:hypothetical protein
MRELNRRALLRSAGAVFVEEAALALDGISTGSLYRRSAAFLPLGLPATDPFWSAPPEPWTSRRAWSGDSFPIDHAVS